MKKAKWNKSGFTRQRPRDPSKPSHEKRYVPEYYLRDMRTLSTALCSSIEPVSMSYKDIVSYFKENYKMMNINSCLVAKYFEPNTKLFKTKQIRLEDGVLHSFVTNRPYQEYRVYKPTILQYRKYPKDLLPKGEGPLITDS